MSFIIMRNYNGSHLKLICKPKKESLEIFIFMSTIRATFTILFLKAKLKVPMNCCMMKLI